MSVLVEAAQGGQEGRTKESMEAPESDLADLDDVDALVCRLQQEGILKREPGDTKGAEKEDPLTEKRRAELKSKVQVRYYALLASGMRANAAAAQAILELKKGQQIECFGREVPAHQGADPASPQEPLHSPRCEELIDEGFALLETPAKQSAGSEGAPGTATISSLEDELGAGYRDDLSSLLDDQSLCGILDSPEFR